MRSTISSTSESSSPSFPAGTGKPGCGRAGAEAMEGPKAPADQVDEPPNGFAKRLAGTDVDEEEDEVGAKAPKAAAPDDPGVGV